MTTADSIRPTLQEAFSRAATWCSRTSRSPPPAAAASSRCSSTGPSATPARVTEPTAPLTLDEVADATHLVSDALDASDVMGEQPYTLEVSSPGVGRPLTEPRHFRRNVGRLVTVQHDGGEVTGRVVSASTTEVSLEVPATKGTPARTETLPYAAVERAVVQVEFARPDESKES